MQENIHPDILTRPMADLPFSEIFKQWAIEHKWDDLKQLLTVHAGELQRKKGFNMHLYVELTNFLQKNHLLHLLKQRQEP
jgi:hypothetical protein